MSAQFATTCFVPTPDQFAWTFGGREAVMRVRPGDVLEPVHGGCVRRADPLH